MNQTPTGFYNEAKGRGTPRTLVTRNNPNRSETPTGFHNTRLPARKTLHAAIARSNLCAPDIFHERTATVSHIARLSRRTLRLSCRSVRGSRCAVARHRRNGRSRTSIVSPRQNSRCVDARARTQTRVVEMAQEEFFAHEDILMARRVWSVFVEPCSLACGAEIRRRSNGTPSA